MRQSLLEEVDIVRLTLQFRDELGLSAALVALEVRHAAESLREAAQKIVTFSKLIIDDRRSEGAYDPQLKNLKHELIELSHEMQAAACELALY